MHTQTPASRARKPHTTTPSECALSEDHAPKSLPRSLKWAVHYASCGRKLRLATCLGGCHPRTDTPHSERAPCTPALWTSPSVAHLGVNERLAPQEREKPQKHSIMPLSRGYRAKSLTPLPTSSAHLAKFTLQRDLPGSLKWAVPLCVVRSPAPSGARLEQSPPSHRHTFMHTTMIAPTAHPKKPHTTTHLKRALGKVHAPKSLPRSLKWAVHYASCGRQLRLATYLGGPHPRTGTPLAKCAPCTRPAQV